MQSIYTFESNLIIHLHFSTLYPVQTAGPGGV